MQSSHMGLCPCSMAPKKPATGRKATIPGSVTVEFKNGKIVREDAYFDQMGMMAQLGLLPGA